MDHLILGLMLLCSPFEVRTETGMLIQHNCHSFNRRFVDETWAKVMKDQPAWVRSTLPDISKMVVGNYYTERECNPAILYAVGYGDMQTYVLIVHPTILRDYNEAVLARAFLHLALVEQWKRPVGSGELTGCTQ